MRPRYSSKYKLKPEDEPYAQAFEAWARGAGWKQDAIDAAFGWYANAPLGASRDELANHFYERMSAAGLPTDEIDLAVGWHGHVDQHGVGEISIDPRDAALEQQLEQFRDIRRRGEDLTPEQEAAERQLIDADLKGGAAHVPAASPTNSRLAEIREMRRNDPDAYDGNAALRAEELQLLSADMPSTPAAPANEGAAE